MIVHWLLLARAFTTKLHRRQYRHPSAPIYISALNVRTVLYITYAGVHGDAPRCPRRLKDAPNPFLLLSQQPPSMARTSLTLFALLAILFAVYYQISLKHLLSANGIWRAIESVGNADCKKLETLQACESAYPKQAEKRIICQLTCLQRWCCILRAVFSFLLALPQPLAATGFQPWRFWKRISSHSMITSLPTIQRRALSSVSHSRVSLLPKATHPTV